MGLNRIGIDSASIPPEVWEEPARDLYDERVATLKGAMSDVQKLVLTGALAIDTYARELDAAQQQAEKAIELWRRAREPLPTYGSPGETLNEIQSRLRLGQLAAETAFRALSRQQKAARVLTKEVVTVGQGLRQRTTEPLRLPIIADVV